jgi:hypothetical protein
MHGKINQIMERRKVRLRKDWLLRRDEKHTAKYPSYVIHAPHALPLYTIGLPGHLTGDRLSNVSVDAFESTTKIAVHIVDRGVDYL